MKYTNKHNIPAAIAEVIMADDYDHSDNPNAIGVNALIDSPKIRQLAKLHSAEITIDVADLLWVFFGKMGHSVIEKISPDKRLIETRIEEEIDGYLLRGRPDLFDIETGELADHKFTSVWSYIFASEKTSYYYQLNIYAYLLRGQGYEVKCLKNYLYLRDWRKSEMKISEDYPRIAFATLEQPIMTDKEIESFIFERIAAHRDAEGKSPDVLHCTDQERWAKKPTFAVFKKGDADKGKRALRVYDSRTEAEAHTMSGTELNALEVIERPGDDVRCQNYCAYAIYCNYAKERGYI
jgi:hypothetical protein